MPAELIQTPMFIPAECAKKVVSNSPGLVNSIYSQLARRAGKVFWEFTVINPAHQKNFFGLYKLSDSWARTF